MNYLERRKRMTAGELFWLLDGMTYAQCLGAYRFKGAINTAADALKDLTGHNNNLSNSGCSWSASNGFYVPMQSYLDQASLRSSGSIQTVVMKISGASHNNAALPLTGNWGGVGVWLSTPFTTGNFWYEQSLTLGVTHGNGLSVNYQTDYTHGTLPRTSVQTAGSFYSSGVIGFTLSSESVYVNGSGIGKSIATYSSHGEWSGYIAAVVPRLVGGYNDGSGSGWASLSNHSFGGAFSIHAMAIYSKALSASEHRQVYQKMLAV